MPFTGVLGFPVAHSRSPAMMNAAFAELGLDWRYLHLPLPPERFAATAAALPGSGYRGANVTIPHKLAAHDLADEVSEPAAAIGAVNTLSFEPDGRMLGDNTDAGGLLDALGGEPGASALVLGAGGAARAAVWALREAGTDVTIWTRTPARGQALALEFGLAYSGQSRAGGGARERDLGGPRGRRHAGWAAARGGRDRGGPRLRQRAHSDRALGARSEAPAWSTESRSWCGRGHAASSSGRGARRPSRSCGVRRWAALSSTPGAV